MTGNRSQAASQRWRSASRRSAMRNTSPPARATSSMSQPQWRISPLSESISTVSQGSWRCWPANTPATWGTTEVSRNTTIASATSDTMAG